MHVLKGFLSYSTLIDNTRDQVALFGELSSDALTFAKDKTYHSDDQAPQTTLVSFHSVEDGTPVEIPSTAKLVTLKVGQFLLDQSLQGAITDDAALMLGNIQQEFGGDITNLTAGEQQTDGTLYLPEWISFDVPADDSTVLVWLSDESFRYQYSEYQVEVIAPILPLDDFFRDPLQVRDDLDAYDIVAKTNAAQSARGEYPYTQLLARRFDYVDPQNTDFTVPSYWFVLVYGQAGNNPDVIKRAIQDYILENSSHDRNDWTSVLPGLFLTTEFVITPLWTQYSVPNKELQAGIYSPIINPRQVATLLKQTTRGVNYDDTWIDDQYELGTVIYKSLAFGVVGNPDNQDGVVSLSEKFPDFMLVTNTSSDYDRMQPRTQTFLSHLSDLIYEAESLSPTSSLPTGMSVLEREEMTYVALTYEAVTYLVATKESVETQVGG